MPCRSLVQVRVVRSRLDRCQKINIGASRAKLREIESGVVRKKTALNLLTFFLCEFEKIFTILFFQPNLNKNKLQASSFTTLVKQQKIVYSVDEPSVWSVLRKGSFEVHCWAQSHVSFSTLQISKKNLSEFESEKKESNMAAVVQGPRGSRISPF